MKTIIKNTWIIFAITLVAGILLGFFYEITADARAEQEAKKVKEAYMAVFEGADSFEEFTDYDADAMAQYIAEGENGVAADVAGVVSVAQALDASGSLLGYVFTVDSYQGYGGTIEFTVGIQNDGTVNKYSILSISETAGLGMKAQSDEGFYSQFDGKNVEYFTYTKSGASADNEIDAITGATITTKAMTYGMNAAIFAFDYLTGEAK